MSSLPLSESEWEQIGRLLALRERLRDNPAAVETFRTLGFRGQGGTNLFLQIGRLYLTNRIGDAQSYRIAQDFADYQLRMMEVADSGARIDLDLSREPGPWWDHVRAWIPRAYGAVSPFIKAIEAAKEASEAAKRQIENDERTALARAHREYGLKNHDRRG
jgi:hypothetical protein